MLPQLFFLIFFVIKLILNETMQNIQKIVDYFSNMFSKECIKMDVKLDVIMFVGFIRLRRGFCSSWVWCGNEPARFHDRRWISWQTERLQSVLYSSSVSWHLLPRVSLSNHDDRWFAFEKLKKKEKNKKKGVQWRALHLLQDWKQNNYCCEVSQALPVSPSDNRMLGLR